MRQDLLSSSQTLPEPVDFSPTFDGDIPKMMLVKALSLHCQALVVQKKNMSPFAGSVVIFQQKAQGLNYQSRRLGMIKSFENRFEASKMNYHKWPHSFSIDKKMIINLSIHPFSRLHLPVSIYPMFVEIIFITIFKFDKSTISIGPFSIANFLNVYQRLTKSYPSHIHAENSPLNFIKSHYPLVI